MNHADMTLNVLEYHMLPVLRASVAVYCQPCLMEEPVQSVSDEAEG